MAVDPERLYIFLLEAHMNSLNEYRKDLALRITNVLFAQGAPKSLASTMGAEISKELSKILAHSPYEEVQKKIQGML